MSPPPSSIAPDAIRRAVAIRGRSGIYELIVVDDSMRTMIHDGVSEQELERHARKMTPSIRDDGRAKILRGESTLEEVLRVTVKIDQPTLFSPAKTTLFAGGQKQHRGWLLKAPRAPFSP